MDETPLTKAPRVAVTPEFLAHQDALQAAYAAKRRACIEVRNRRAAEDDAPEIEPVTSPESSGRRRGLQRAADPRQLWLEV